MSAIPPGAVGDAVASIAGQQALRLVQAVLVLRRFIPQSIAGHIGSAGPFPSPTVWIEEQHTDTMIITEHPVESGATVSDHAFAKPVEVTIKLGWKEDLPLIQALYTQILDLKNARTLFDIQTGKRLYQDMLIANISVMTDQKSANVLLATVTCKQIILVNTQIIYPPENQRNPSSTAQAANNGTKTLIPGSNFNPAGMPTTIPGALT